MTAYDSQLVKLIAGAVPASQPSQSAETLAPEEMKELLAKIKGAPQPVHETRPQGSPASRTTGMTGY